MILIRTVLSTIALVCVLLPGAPDVTANERGHFSERDVKGPMTFFFDGFLNVGMAAAPVAALGRVISDGRGNLTSGVRTLVIGGTPSHQTFECTYTVNADGTGTATCDVTGGPLAVETFDFVIVERHERTVFTGTTAGVTIRGETKRQR